MSTSVSSTDEIPTRQPRHLQEGTGVAMPIAAPTVPIGTNPKVTADPLTQGGTIGPTAQVNTQKFGETFSPAPSMAPVETDAPDSSPAGNPSMPPNLQMAAATIGMTGMAALL